MPCFLRPAPELWAVPAGRVHAIQDITPVVLNNLPAAFKDTFREQFPEVSASKGFNSGVLAMRPSDWRDLPERFEAALARCRFPSYTGILDQPLLNTILRSAVAWLPFEYNTTSLSDRPIPKEAPIIHYTGPEKPWMAGFPKHEPSYYKWAKFVLEGTSPLQLFSLRVRILIRTPRRLLARRIRRFLRDRKRSQNTVSA